MTEMGEGAQAKGCLRSHYQLLSKFSIIMVGLTPHFFSQTVHSTQGPSNRQTSELVPEQSDQESHFSF